MTYEEAAAYIENCTWSSAKIGLDRTAFLLKALGNPQKDLKFVHVTGSNGKGSTCAMTESILRRAGFRTGLFTSPYIQRFSERIQVMGRQIPDADLVRLTEKLKPIADGMDDRPSQFELVTAIAMEYFKEQSCDIVVLEVGMGGTYDSTNVISAPEAAVITNIGLEHTEYLGSTAEEIAKTKAGIIKSGCRCVCYDGQSCVTGIIKEDCLKKGVPFAAADFSRISLVKADLKGQSFKYKDEEYFIPLLGRHQLCNAAVTLEVICALRQRGWNIPDEAVKAGLSSVIWPARFEVLSHKPLFILDGGHNPQCAEALSGCISEYLKGKKIRFVCGVLKDKDYISMLKSVLPFAERFYCAAPDSQRALAAESLKDCIEKLGKRAQAYESPEAAAAAAMADCNENECVIAFGSLYLAGTVRNMFVNIPITT